MASLGFNVSEFVFHLRPIIIFLFFISAMRSAILKLKCKKKKKESYELWSTQQTIFTN